jgi:hypothetical protein
MNDYEDIPLMVMPDSVAPSILELIFLSSLVIGCLYFVASL